METPSPAINRREAAARTTEEAREGKQKERGGGMKRDRKKARNTACDKAFGEIVRGGKES